MGTTVGLSMPTPLTNNELILLRSRVFRGYRAPVAVSEFYTRENIISMTRDVNSNITQLVQQIIYDDGQQAIKTTDFTLDINGNIQSSVVTYAYNQTP